MAGDATAIYIDDSAIRFLRVSGRRPRQWAVEPLKAGLVRDGLVVDEAAVATAIRTLWAKEQPGSQRVIAGISGINCLYRVLTLPELPRNLLPEAVKREASRAFGVPLDQLHISWQTLPGKPNETLVYVAAAPRTTVDGLIRTLKQANLNPYMMDIVPLALARSTAEPSALIADLQPAGLDIVLKMAGMPEVIRSVSVTPGGSLTDRVTVVRQELQRAVTFFNSSHPDTPVGDDIPLLVAGELGDHQEVWPELLGRAAGRRIEALQPPLEIPAGFTPYLYAPTIGLALKQTAGKALEGYSRVSFNMLPEIYIPKPRPLSELLFPPALLVGVLAVAALGYMLYNTSALTGALREQADASSQLVITLGAGTAAQKQALEAQVSTLQTEASAKETSADLLDNQLRGYATNNDAINTDLGEINRTPSGVDLDTVTHSGPSATISGWGASEASVFTYARQLRTSGRWSLVVLTTLYTDDVQTAFALTLVG